METTVIMKVVQINVVYDEERLPDENVVAAVEKHMRGYIHGLDFWPITFENMTVKILPWPLPQPGTRILIVGSPMDGFRFFGPFMPNDPDVEEFIEREYHGETWWYAEIERPV